MRQLLAIVAALALMPSALLAQKPEVSKHSYSTEAIRQVLILARDAVLQEQSDGDSAWLGRHQEAIILSFKSIDDWQDASVLQKKTGSLYAPPHPTLADYKALQDSLRNLDEYAREPSLSVVVGESASEGFFDYAEHLAATIKDAQTQSDAYLEIGAALWKKGEHDTARKYFDLSPESVEYEHPHPSQNRA